MDVAAVAGALREEAGAVGERRMLVLTGNREATYDAVRSALSAVDLPLSATTLVGPGDELACERVEQVHAGRLLGTTREAVVFDAHRDVRPNALGAVVGAVDGGGLFVLLAPPLDDWPGRADRYRDRLTVPPFEPEAVGDRFRTRLVETLRSHRGVAVVAVDEGVVENDGLTDPAPRPAPDPVRAPPDHDFPPEAYEACRTRDQADAVAALERLREPGLAVVVESDRGRGKSSAAGLAAGSLAAAGESVLVTAPEYRSAAPVFERARSLLEDLDSLAVRGRERVRADSGGRISFAPPADAAERAGETDVLVVDEAAAVPVQVLSDCLAADRVAFATTVHGYEGAGRGFSVRFRDRLGAGDHAVTEVTLDEPIRYAAGDPVEVWAFRALLLDARPPVDQVVEGARPATVEYRALDRDDLLADENRLREAFGLLVLAHYRTEPDDLARLLDAPNVAVRALVHDGHVASVALLAREGDLPAGLRAETYDGGRVRGNMIPDVLTSQLRDEAAGAPAGLRVLRIATHHAARSRGLGSRLLAEVEREFAAAVDWFGTAFGATPGLLSFWADAGYRVVHLSTTRNDRSGEYSAVLLSPVSEAGRDLHDRHASWFAERVPGLLSDALRDADPDVVRAALAATDAAVDPALSARDWRVVAGAAYGPGLLDVDPAPFRDLVATHLLDPADPDALSARQERLLVARVLQARRWSAVADRLDFHSTGQCMRATGDALRPLVDLYGDETAAAERERYGD